MSNLRRGPNPERESGSRRIVNIGSSRAPAGPARVTGRETTSNAIVIAHVANGTSDDDNDSEFYARYCRAPPFQQMVHSNIRRYYEGGHRSKAISLHQSVEAALISQCNQGFMEPKPAGCLMAVGFPMTSRDFQLIETRESIQVSHPLAGDKERFRVAVTTNAAFRTAMLDLCYLQTFSTYQESLIISASFQRQLRHSRVPYNEKDVAARWRQSYPLFEKHLPELVGLMAGRGMEDAR